MTEPRDPVKGALYADAIAKCTLNDLIDLVCLKATLSGAEIRVKVTYPKNAARGRKR